MSPDIAARLKKYLFNKIVAKWKIFLTKSFSLSKKMHFVDLMSLKILTPKDSQSQWVYNWLDCQPKKKNTQIKVFTSGKF